MLRTLTATMAAMTLSACTGELGIRNNGEPPPVPAARPPQVTEQTDFITQVTTPEVDVLFVIDNSCSMFDNQVALGQNFPKFMEFFKGSGLDYHIGAISTDVFDQFNAGILQESDGYRFITPAVSNPEDVFTGMAVLGSNGANIERGHDAAYTMLELRVDDAPNRGFYRDDAAIHTVCVSDEPDQSELNTQAEFTRWYDGLKPELDMRSISSIVSFANGGNYRAVTAQIGGVEYDIDQPNWEVVLERLGIQASGLKREYFLSQQPVIDTITVSILRDTGQPQPVEIRFEPAIFDDTTDPPTLVSGEWSYNQERNSITFEVFVPDPLDVIKVKYTLLSAAQSPIDDDQQEDVKTP